MHHQRRGHAMTWIIILAVITLAGLGAWTLRGASASSSAWLNDIDEGAVTAREQNRPLLVLFTADWCPPCQAFKREVFSDAEVAGYLERTFVLVKIDLTNRKGPNNHVAIEYEVEGIPTLIAYDSWGAHLEDYRGPRTKGDFLQWARKIRATAAAG